MTKTTIKEYFKNVQNPIGNTPPFEPFNVENFMSQLEDFTKITYGSLCLRPSILEDCENLSELQNVISVMCYNVYVTNRYKYETLFDTMNFEYNPIDNYNMTEHESISGTETTDSTTHTGPQTNSHTDSSSSIFGAIEKTSTSNDSKTNVFGEQTTTKSETTNTVNEYGETEENAA